MAAFKVLETQFQTFIKSRIYLDEEYVIMTRKYFLEYTQLEIQEFRDTLIQHMEYVKKSIDERAPHKRDYDSRGNERQMQTTEEKIDTSKALDVILVHTESSGTEFEKQDTSSRSRNDAYADDADIRPIYDEEPMAKSERPRISKPWFASKVDVNNDFSKLVTVHYFPKERESVFAKPHHVIASSESRNSSKNMLRFSSNDMVHNHYLEEARKKTKEKGRNSRPSMIPSPRSQSIANGSKPKPRINNQKSRNWPASKSSFVKTKIVPIAEHFWNSSNFSDSKHFVCSTCQKCIFKANHDACVTKFLNVVNSCAKVPSHKTTNRNKLVEQISVAKKPERHIPKGHRFSIKKTFVVHEKTKTPRSCLRWKPTGRILKIVGLRWVPTRKIFTSSTTMVDSEPPHGSNTNITNLHECIQTLDSSASTTINVQEEQNLDLSAGTPFNLKKERIKAWIKENVISGRPRLHGTTLIQEISARPKFYGYDLIPNNILIHDDSEVIRWLVTNGNPSSVTIKQHHNVPVLRTSKHGESNTSMLEDPTL
ncbi:hypothetical protein Tco_0174984 [Tanacetum coccineum]